MSRKDWSAFAGIALLYILLESLGVTCPIRFLTGVSCAGCGMSRAWLSLLRLDMTGALYYHPLFWLPIPAAALLLFQRRLPKRVFSVGLGLCGALFLTVYFIRLGLPGDVVVFDPGQGFFCRLLSGVLGGVEVKP